jgi:hypothetical protein
MDIKEEAVKGGVMSEGAQQYILDYGTNRDPNEGESYTITTFTFNWARVGSSDEQFKVEWVGTSNGYYWEGVDYEITYVPEHPPVFT